MRRPVAASAGSREGQLPSGTLSPILRQLVEDKRVLARDEPLSTRPGKPTLYRIADAAPVAKRVEFAGSIKWLESAFDGHDLSDLINAVANLPGFRRDSGLLIVSLSGVDERADPRPVDVVWGPGDVLDAWRD
ncbi:hypothetical protein [Stackebrandtia nassauensis]|uniref:Uncharacterized protein n=1 Tax=Stackebrandtia nassauensis (strain DSM 44728 / CIP 108903 / NRRL B-16338 / NBRC 102104 / LLR-40K-21) TaxID=446470 RepID=D3PVV9_STANL|nr:hypothetical protein [Stackebrandtia nassauensis]ADD45080.1 hypothetical protein Snas_5448 [Stackebrandtia nassauensis DSM 44728]